MIQLARFETIFFTHLKRLGGQWEMSPFIFAKEVGYEGAHAREMILHWIGWSVVTAAFVVLMIWKFVIGVPEDSFVIFGAAQSQAESHHRAIVARADRLTRLTKYCGFASLGLLRIGGAVWVYRGIVAVNGGRTP